MTLKIISNIKSGLENVFGKRKVDGGYDNFKDVRGKGEPKNVFRITFYLDNVDTNNNDLRSITQQIVGRLGLGGKVSNIKVSLN